MDLNHQVLDWEGKEIVRLKITSKETDKLSYLMDFVTELNALSSVLWDKEKELREEIRKELS